MNGLTEFTLARITKDAARAEYVHVLDCELNAGEWMTTGECDCGQPERVLADCEAKRRLVSEHGGGPSCETCYDFAPMDWPCPTLRILAAVYVDHPDYREEWKP